MHVDFVLANLDYDVAVAFGTDTSTSDIAEIVGKLGIVVYSKICCFSSHLFQTRI